MSERYNFVDKPGLVLRNMVVDATGYDDGIVLNNCPDAVVENVEVYNARHAGLFLIDSDRTRVTLSTFHDIDPGGNAIYVNARWCGIEHCDFWHADTFIWLHIGFPDKDADYNIISHCLFRGARHGAVAISGNHNVVFANTFVDCQNAVLLGYKNGGPGTGNTGNIVLRNIGWKIGEPPAVKTQTWVQSYDTVELDNTWL